MHFTLQRLGGLFKGRRRSESETAQFGRDARADWQLVFISFILLNLLVFIGNVFVYRQINKGEIFLVPKKEPLSLRALNREELKQTIEFFESKQTRFESLQTTPIAVPGPGPARKK